MMMVVVVGKGVINTEELRTRRHAGLPMTMRGRDGPGITASVSDATGTPTVLQPQSLLQANIWLDAVATTTCSLT